MTAEEFLERWGEDDFTCADPERAEALGMPATAVRFLSEVGLPRACAPMFQFDLEEGMTVLPHGGQVFLRIGAEEEFSVVCLDDRGSVVTLDPSGEFLPVFVNSSAVAFAECLLLYRESLARTEVLEVPKPEKVSFLGMTYEIAPPQRQDPRVIRTELARLRAEIERVDRPAVQRDTWWTQLLEEEQAQYT
jgi:hypothetical protein